MRPAGRAGPTVLLAAGLEGTGAVGLLADAFAVQAAGGVPSVCVTALTVQGRRFRCQAVSSSLLAAQLEAAVAHPHRRPAAVKLGMVPDARTLAVLWPVVLRLGVPVVVDPVVRTSLGQRLSTLGPEAYRALAGPRVWLTPNVAELAWLLGQRTAPRAVEEVMALALALLAHGFAAVVVKGGHLHGPPTDVLVSPQAVVQLRGRRLPRGGGARGTGCRFASTLATQLARGVDGPRAVWEAKAAVRGYLQAERFRRPGRGSRSG